MGGGRWEGGGWGGGEDLWGLKALLLGAARVFACGFLRRNRCCAGGISRGLVWVDVRGRGGTTYVSPSKEEGRGELDDMVGLDFLAVESGS